MPDRELIARIRAGIKQHHALIAARYAKMKRLGTDIIIAADPARRCTTPPYFRNFKADTCMCPACRHRKGFSVGKAEAEWEPYEPPRGRLRTDSDRGVAT